MNELLERIIWLQELEGESDYTFARRLNIPRSTWQLTRTGKRKLNQKIIDAVNKEFPHRLNRFSIIYDNSPAPNLGAFKRIKAALHRLFR